MKENSFHFILEQNCDIDKVAIEYSNFIEDMSQIKMER